MRRAAFARWLAPRRRVPLARRHASGARMNPLDSWVEEQRSAYLYRACADAENGTVRAELFRRLAGEAEAQAAIWRAQLTARGYPAPGPFVPDARTRLVANLVQWLGPRRLRNVLAAMKVRGMAVYGASAPAESPHAVPASPVTLERRHRGLAGSGNLRAAVFGVNDGLVSNAGLILGVAGATSDVRMIVLSGVAGMAAGALAMAAGEYVSVKSQRELYEYQIALERDELAQYPEAEAQELALIYAAKGLPVKQADRLAKRLVADPENALDTLAREELGLNPGHLGSPIGAAVSSCVAFAAGALVPLAPYLFRMGPDALAWTIGLAAAGLFIVGAVLSLFTGRNGLYSGARMLVLGAAAGAVTFGIGHWLGVATG
ncbi:MAG TPA: VIT1/CCC1 transporter family protein [Casimicrobiaceae bacterium]|nr:VIT1/CCC1 transporter family protein [Casimicrobiaceae bacterium]